MTDKTVKVLLIEGDADEAAIVRSHLTNAGLAPALDVRDAARLSTASHLLEREAFDAVVIDVAMPQCVGIEGFRKIRAQKPDLPIVILTGMKDEALAAEAVSLGAQDYVIKGSLEYCALKRTVRHAIERKRLLSELERASAPRATEAAGAESGEGAGEVKNLTMSRISHELRNALATVKTAVFCLGDAGTGPLTPRQQRLVDMISRNVDRQGRILENVLDLSRLQAGKMKLEFRPVELHALAEEIAAEFRIKEKTRRLILDLEDSLPPAAGDADLLLQVLRNLLDNAFRYAKSRVVLKAGRSGEGELAVSVMDDGPGIPPARLRELFADFVQLDRPKAGGGYKGSGLGLAICREIVEGHRGRIWAESGAPHGARFHLSLRVFAAPSGAPAAPKAVTAPSKMIHPAGVGLERAPRL